MGNNCFNSDKCKFIGFNNINSIISVILNIIKIFFSISIFIFSLLIKFDSEVSRTISYELIENFQSGYFLDFRFCNSNENRINFGTWPGTVKGCGKIENGRPKANILDEKKEDKCNKNEIFLDNIPSQDIFSFKGLTICGTTKGNYYNLLFSDSVVELNENCPEGKKNCGYIDTIKNKLCFDNSLECPISYIKIKDINGSAPEGINNLKEIKTEKIRFYYSNNPYSKNDSKNASEIPYITNSFKIADSKICALSNLYYSNIDLYSLEALKKKYSENCILKDYSQEITIDQIRYHEINTINHYELYEENGIIDKIKNFNLTNFGFNVDKYKANDLKLYVRTHFGFNKTCLKQRKKGFNLEELNEINSNSDKMKTWSIITACFFGISTVSSVSFFFKIYDDNFGIMLIKYLLTIAPTFISFLYTVIWAVYFDDSYEEYMICSDFVTNFNYNTMIEKIRKNGIYIFICTILITIVFSFDIIIVIFKCCCCTKCCSECCIKCCCSCCINCCKKICGDIDVKNNESIQKDESQNINKIDINEKDCSKDNM